MANEIHEVAIIGSGCAGITAALYTARAQLGPTVLTGAMPGGLLTTTSIVENYPGFPEGVDGTELMISMQQQAERFGAKIKFGSTVGSVDLSVRPFELVVDGGEMAAALAVDGPALVEIDMTEIGPFARPFAGPPVRKVE